MKNKCPFYFNYIRSNLPVREFQSERTQNSCYHINKYVHLLTGHLHNTYSRSKWESPF